jgi:E3 ubiquitin-protein ligase HUWE1
MLGQPVQPSDLEMVDADYYKSLLWMLDNDITGVIHHTFSVETDNLGVQSVQKIIDLKPNGRNIPVTEENKAEYVRLVTEHRLTGGIQEQIDYFLEGFWEIIPKELIQIFSDSELELLISE